MISSDTRAAGLPFGTLTVGELLRQRAQDTPDRLFLLVESPDGSVESFNFEQTLELAMRGARVLGAIGIAPGDRCGLAINNRSEFMACWFGAALLGAAVVPMNPEATRREFAHMVSHSKAGAVVAIPDAVEAFDADVRVVELGQEFDDLASVALSAPASIDPLAPLGVLYTSGTTSLPKGVVVTHANYLAAGEVMARHLRVRPDDRWLVVLPMYHANAQYYSVMSALVSGASVALMPRFSASRWGEQARRHHATLGSLFAAPIRMILNHAARPEDSDNCLRVVCFAQNVPSPQLLEFEERFDCPLLQLYGMTETIAPPLANPLDRRRDNMTVGFSTGASVRLVDERGEAVVGDLPGELQVSGRRGVDLMAGYLDDPDATAAAFDGDWLRTGDIVRRRDDGAIEFVDRIKHMIKTGGENVAAAEIEHVVNEHELVLESAAVGVPDDIRDEQLHVYVVCRSDDRPTEEEILAHCAAHLAKFKVPRAVHFVDELPRTSVGKIQKHRLGEYPMPMRQPDEHLDERLPLR